MNKVLLLIFALGLGSNVLQAMVSNIISQPEVFFCVGEGEAGVKIQYPANYRGLSKTVQSCLNDCEGSCEIPLEFISPETLHGLISLLADLDSATQNQDIQALKRLKTRLTSLEGNALIRLLYASDYLDIQLLTRLVYEELLKRKPETILAENLGSLHERFRRALFKPRLAALLGMTYEGLSVETSEDEEAYVRDKRLLVVPQLAICMGHEGWVRSVCVTSDNKIVSGSEDNSVRVWDMEGKQLAICRGHEDSVYSACLTADNKIVYGSEDNSVRVCDMEGKQLAICNGHEGIVYSVCVTGDNKIVSGSLDGTVRVWDMEGKQLAICRGHEGDVIDVCVTGDNKIVSGALDGTVRVWDMEGNQLAICKGHEGAVWAVCVAGNNKIVSGSQDGTVCVWDIQGNQLAIWRGHKLPVSSVRVTSDNKIVFGSDDGTVRVWDMQGKELAICRGHAGNVYSVCVTGDNKIVSASHDKTVRVWDSEKLTVLEKALLEVGKSVEKCSAIWKLIQNSSMGAQDAQVVLKSAISEQ